MDTKEEIKSYLDAVLDHHLKEFGFARRKGGLMYTRQQDQSKQEIHLNIESSPLGFPGVIARINPNIRMKMPSVTKRSLELAGSPSLLANAEELVISQPMEFVAPPEERVRWLLSTEEEVPEIMAAVGSFIKKWVIPFLDQVSTVSGLLKLYETNDNRLLKQQHWYIHVAASYLALGDSSKAKAVLEKHLGAPGLRKMYANAFEKLA